jgi:protein-S-isoprenylcysteine O-methyltransferase Ste14
MSFNLLSIVKAIWSVMNGKKFDTGTVVVLMAIVIQQVLNVDHDTSLTLASQVMAGSGTLLAIIGVVHRWIKARIAKQTPVAQQPK